MRVLHVNARKVIRQRRRLIPGFRGSAFQYSTHSDPLLDCFAGFDGKLRVAHAGKGSPRSSAAMAAYERFVLFCFKRMYCMHTPGWSKLWTLASISIIDPGLGIILLFQWLLLFLLFSLFFSCCYSDYCSYCSFLH